MKHNSLNPDQLQVDSHVLQLAGNGAGAGAMSICPQTSIPGLSYSAPYKYLVFFLCKISVQVGEHIHKEPSEQLNDRLFYL